MPAVFARPAYRRLWMARTVSQCGDIFATVALSLLVFDLTGSALGVSGGLLTDQLIRRVSTEASRPWRTTFGNGSRSGTRTRNPFIWTKTAEDILQSLSNNIAKISDAGH
jgi:hypothetical protein